MNSDVTCPSCQGTMLAKNIQESLYFTGGSHASGSGNDHHQQGRTQSKGSGDAMSCPMCSKQFRYTSLLKRHIMSHTDAKRFICKNCGASYKHSCHLQRHANTCIQKDSSCD